jgi:nucleoside 2-deoxyribosyltransferase
VTRVYLAGPIANMNDKQTHMWREVAARILNEESIDTIDPAKLRDFRNVPFPDDLAVVEPDKADIDSCDVLLANCHTVSVGTSMEILYAWERGKFVVVVHPDPEHCSPWIHYHAHDVVPALWMGLETILRWRKDVTAWTEHDRIRLRALGIPLPEPDSSLGRLK